MTFIFNLERKLSRVTQSATLPEIPQHDEVRANAVAVTAPPASSTLSREPTVPIANFIPQTSPLLSLPSETIQHVLAHALRSARLMPPYKLWDLPFNHIAALSISETSTRLRREILYFLQHHPDPWNGSCRRFARPEPDWTIVHTTLSGVLLASSEQRVQLRQEWQREILPKLFLMDVQPLDCTCRKPLISGQHACPIAIHEVSFCPTPRDGGIAGAYRAIDIVLLRQLRCE